MGDAATFIAPALLVAYLAVGGLLLLVSDVRKQRRSRRHRLFRSFALAGYPRFRRAISIPSKTMSWILHLSRNKARPFH